MKHFWKGVSTVMLYTIGAALLVYAGSRSLDFIQSTLPGNQQIVGFLGLAATSGGMLAWLMLFMFHSQGLGQKVTAGLMTGIDMFGEFGLFTLDTLYRSSQNGMIASLSQDEIRSVILALSALIAINIFSTVAYHLLDSENIRNMREAFVRDQLEAQALKEIEKKGEELARTLAPKLAVQWVKEFESKFSDFRALGFGALSKPETENDASSSDGNAVSPKTDSANQPAALPINIPHPFLPSTNEKVPLAMTPPETVVNGNGHSHQDPT